MINDADAAGLAEVRFGAGRGYHGVVMMLTFGTGIGSGLFIDGVLVPNTELGHLETRRLRRRDPCRGERPQARHDLSWSDWAERVETYLRHVERLFSPDLFIIGGGASKQAEQVAAEGADRHRDRAGADGEQRRHRRRRAHRTGRVIGRRP